MKNKAYLLLILLLLPALGNAQSRINLEGKWRFQLDEKDAGIEKMWYNQTLSEEINLPGTTDEAHKGEKTTGSDFGILTRAYKYYGPAWYQREIEIPQDWNKKNIFLFMERVMWESKVYLDGELLSTQDALSSPHWHDLGKLTPGKHKLTIRINNDLIYNIGDKGHVYSEYTQSIWNGTVGRLELVAKNDIRLNNPQIFTAIAPKAMTVVDTLINNSGKNQEVNLSYSFKDRKTGVQVFRTEQSLKLTKGLNALNFKTNLPSDIKLWDDVNPNLYNLEITIANKKGELDRFTEEIGIREITASNSKILVNGKPVFFRGNLDCVHFPITGYPSCDPEEWMRILKIYKDYGLNHVRFHSWCPPKAAFIAADRLGLYLQPETIWIDWWMEINEPGREEMWTKGLPGGLGKNNPSADEYVQKELRRMIYHYGNHASFAMQCIGNELGNSNFEIMETWMQPLRASDNRRLYSVSSARQVMEVDQFMATHYLPGIGGTRGIAGGASTNWDFEESYSKSKIPVLAHEIGQWPVYPRWSEIQKYKGVLKARNLEEFREQARKNKIEEQNEDFVQASGALNQLMYKYEIESFLRTPSCAGIQLLSMQDYQGQGEALIGWLDAFYDSKGITTPEVFKHHHDTTVTLLRMPKYVWENNENFKAEIQVAHYGTEDLVDGVYWKLRDEQKNVLSQGKVDSRRFALGSANIIGKINADLSGITKASKLQVEIGLEREPIVNHWDIWVYPSKKASAKSKVFTTNRLDDEALKRLNRGENVLLDASGLGSELTADRIAFFPLYWSLTFFPGQGRNTIGMLLQDKHQAFADFPTDMHSDWQWESIYKGAKGFYINDFPEEYKPIAQPVDDFHRNNKLAAIFEFKVGKGKLLVSGFNLSDENAPVARQLKSSLLKYMQSDSFAPTYEPKLDRLKDMFVYVEPLKGVVTQEFNNPMFYVSCASEISKSADMAWAASLDKVSKLRKTEYRATIDGVFVKDAIKAWTGKEIYLEINPPSGMIGSLHVCFVNPDKNGMRGDIEFEGRSYSLNGGNQEKNWVKLHIMREDSNDGILKFAKAPAQSVKKPKLVS